MEIVLVDDGSGPCFLDIFKRAASFAQVISCHKNRGKGAALKAGMKFIQAAYGPKSIIVTVDGDGQRLTGDVLRLRHTAKQHPNALVLGSLPCNLLWIFNQQMI